MIRSHSIIIGLAILVLFSISLSAGVPKAINYQGLLTDGSGNPVPNNSYAVQFSIYDASTGGAIKWTETQSVSTSDGLFSVLLGSVNAIEDTVFNAPARYLGIKVGTDPEISPRTMMVTVPYAMRVSTVDGSSGGIITGKLNVGYNNDNSGDSSFVVGVNDTCTGRFSTIGGGTVNTASGDDATVSGGVGNQAAGGFATVGGGGYNTASGSSATISGGVGNQAAGYLATVGGGYNTASLDFATVSGGGSNQAAEYAATVGGGVGNLAAGYSATVGGGFADTASGYCATVSGGGSNVANGTYSTVGGGRYGYAHGEHSVIGGGGGDSPADSNSALGDYSTISGGVRNYTNASWTVIGGGLSNIASGNNATVPGGKNNSATGDYSFAAGRRAKANHRGTFVWADSTNADFASTGGNQFLIRASGGVGIGTNHPWAGLHIKGPGYPKSFGFFDTDSTGQDAGLRFLEDGIAKSHVFHATNMNTLNLYGDGYSGISIASSGDVGIGTANPNYKLDVRGSIGNNSTLYHSDRRWKQNINTMSNSLDKVQHLRGVSFDWKRDEFAEMNFPEGKQIGLIAQEVEQVLPEVVSTGKDGYKSVDYSKMVALLVEANKEQQKQIVSQQDQINELKELVVKIVAGSTDQSIKQYGQK